MNSEQNIKRFEEELTGTGREGIDRLIAYCRKSDFYIAPSSTQYHLSVSGGLLQHSLNVLSALRSLLRDNGDGTFSYTVAGGELCRIGAASVTLIALLHDLCKTKFYAIEKRNKKINGTWQEVDFFTVSDEIPYGHGEKSVMMAEAFVRLSMEERMAIRWHMGFPEDYQGRTAFGAAVEKYPIVWALHTADMLASHFMETADGNDPRFSDCR